MPIGVPLDLRVLANVAVLTLLAIFVISKERVEVWGDRSRISVTLKLPDFFRPRPAEVGDPMPHAWLLGVTPDAPRADEFIDSWELFAGKRVLLVGVPAAFSPTCSDWHLPSVKSKLPSLKAKGVDMVAITAVESPFTLAAWAHELGMADDPDIKFLADPQAVLMRTLSVYFWAGTLGPRSRRYNMIVEDNIIMAWDKETGGEYTCTDGDTLIDNFEALLQPSEAVAGSDAAADGEL